MTADPYLAMEAYVSSDGLYRYWLSRRLSTGERVISLRKDIRKMSTFVRLECRARDVASHRRRLRQRLTNLSTGPAAKGAQTISLGRVATSSSEWPALDLTGNVAAGQARTSPNGQRMTLNNNGKRDHPYRFNAS